MSEFGLKIKNIQAASIYEYQNGFRNKLDQTEAMLTNSLFLDFLLNNGLKVWKEESTRDVICVLFDYGTDGYDNMKKRVADSITENNKQYLDKILNNIENNKDNCIKISKQDLRTKYYTEGLDITYKEYNKTGEVKSEKTIHYKMLFRTPGKAKKGTCMFINEKLYKKAHDFLYMGIKLPKEKAPIIQMGAYSSLITSTIIGKIQIKPEEILVLDDVDSHFITKVLTVETDINKHCTIREQNNYSVKNTLFDGQALIDSSIFPKWADGYILLRNHMTKCAAFNTNIQLFMHEHFVEDYETATVKDMWGRDVKVKDIKLITTNNAMKWLTFNVDFDYWSEWIRKNDSYWGIVKTTHESKWGGVQRMSYQMTNSLDINSMDDVIKETADYVEKLKTDDEFFIQYLREHVNFSNDFDVLVALVEHNPDFIYSDYFRERKIKIISTIVLQFKSGRIIQNADNLTIVGSPYAMLLHSIGENPLSDNTFHIEDDTIQCWTERFNDGEYLAEFRSPFNSRNNLGYLHNHYHPYFDKYFKFGRLTIAVNMIETCFQDRNNGSDQDSDSIYVTNQETIVKHAKYCYKNYPTIVNLIPKEKNNYNYDMKDFAEVDNKLASAQLAIGESSNLAQLCLTYSYNYGDKKYIDYVCILSVIAQVAIDNAKRKYDIDLTNEIKYIKENMEIKRNGLPYFWEITKKDKRKARTDEIRTLRNKQNKAKIRERINPYLVCPMNYLYNLKFKQYKNSHEIIPIKDFFISFIPKENYRKSKKVEELIEKYSLQLHDFYMNDYIPDGEYEPKDQLLMIIKFEELINDIRSVYLSNNYVGLMSWLINRSFRITNSVCGDINSTLNKNRPILLKTLYTINKDAFLACFSAKNDIHENKNSIKKVQNMPKFKRMQKSDHEEEKVKICRVPQAPLP